MNFDAGNSSGIMMIGNKGVITSEIYANNPTLYVKGEDPAYLVLVINLFQPCPRPT